MVPRRRRGGLGGLLVTWLFTVDLPAKLLAGLRPDQDTVHGIHFAVMLACYAPMAVWGPLTLAAVLGYARRRYGRGRSKRSTVHADHAVR